MSRLALRDSPSVFECQKRDQIWRMEFYFFTRIWIPLLFIVGGIMETPVFAETQASAWESANTAGLEAYRQGRYSDAKQWFLKALTEAEGSGEPSPSKAMTLNNLAAVHEALGESEDAELRYQQSLFIIGSIQGPDHPDLVPGLNNLALLYIQDGKYQQAEPLLRRSLRILEIHLGEIHAHLIPSLLILAQVTQSQNRLQDAVQFYSRALTIADSELGPRHEQTITILHRYARLLRQMNRDAEASFLEERARTIPDPN